MRVASTQRDFVRFGPEGRGVCTRLIALPYAGAGAGALRAWRAAAPSGCDFWAAQLPGREHRLGEEPFHEAHEAAAALANALIELPALPFVLMGHSMGALLGFLVARRLQDLGRPGPAHLFVSGFRAPQLPDNRRPIAHLPDGDFRGALRRLGGTPTEVLENDELMTLLLPALRADFELVEGYRHREAPRLLCPITAFAGRDDEEAGPNSMEGWDVHTSRSFELVPCAGGHFFISANASPAIARIRSTMEELVGLARR